MADKLKALNPLKARYDFDRMSNWGYTGKQFQNEQANKINVRGKQKSGYADPLVRLREDKLRSMKRALFNSYQSAIIQFDKDKRVEEREGFHFRCLINHDKLKVDYQDKILSIPFREVPVEYQHNRQLSSDDKFQDTGTPGIFYDELGNPVLNEQGQPITAYRVKPGDTFKWISGNEGYMPDSYWIIFLQYSEQTAYFRGEIRKADDEISILPIGEDGTAGKDPIIYHGWTTGPNEDEAIWNVKKGVVWNDLYYSKILYITKDENTQAYFKRFDRVIVNGQTWEVQGYNDNYGTTSKNADGGMIRVALKQTYTSTNEVLEEIKQKFNQTTQETIGQIYGPETVQTYDVITYYLTSGSGQWSVSAAAPVTIIEQTGDKVKLEIGQVKTTTTFELYCGEKTLSIKVKPFK